MSHIKSYKLLMGSLMFRYYSYILSAMCIFYVNTVFADSKQYNTPIEPPLQAIQKIISMQIQAFRENKPETAYSFASEFIKAKFPSPAIFMAMVKGSYPMIWSPQKYKFVEQRNHASNVIQRVVFTDTDDNLYFFDYLMLKSDDAWRIHGVYLVQSGGIGT